MISAAFPTISEADIDQLVSSGRSEGRDLEFKRDLPGGKDDEVKEFLADVSSLANAQGGDLLFGILDNAGVASEVSGVGASDVDAAILRLENICRDGLEPRVNGIKTRWVPVRATGVIVMRVPASFAAPHRIRFKNSGRFFTRNSRGKYEMDTHELRSAFTESDALPKRFRSLHEEAVAGADGKDVPYPIEAAPRAIVSISPVTFFRERRDLDIRPEQAVMFVKPSGSVFWMETLEGALVHAPPSDKGAVRAYALTHRTGRLDAAWTVGGVRQGLHGDEMKLVWPKSFEEGLLDMGTAIAAKLAPFGIEDPWVVSSSVSGTEGFRLTAGDGYATKPAWRDFARLPDLIVETFTNETLLPVFKAFWLLFGERRPT